MVQNNYHVAKLYKQKEEWCQQIRLKFRKRCQLD